MKALLFAAAVAAGVTATAQDLPKLGVLDFQANGASEQLASAASGVAANEIEKLGLFKVITSEAIRSLLAIERQKQLLGCTEADCMAELSGALGIDYALTGKVSRIEGKGGMPTTWTLELTLLYVAQSRREGSDVQTAQSEAELLGKVNRAVTKVLARVLEGRSGFLVVGASEAGAVVKVDDVVVGTTPLPNRLTLTGGPHFLVVEKAGFVTWQKQLRVNPAELTDEQATLVPSADYVREYEARANRMRLGAWISTGVAIAAGGTAGYFGWQAAKLYGQPNEEGTFAWHQSKLQQGIETEGEGAALVDHRAEALSLATQIRNHDLITQIGIGVAAAGAVGATYFFIAGDDPGRYARYRAQVTLLPTQGGGLAFVGGVF